MLVVVAMPAFPTKIWMHEGIAKLNCKCVYAVMFVPANNELVRSSTTSVARIPKSFDGVCAGKE